VIAAVVAFLVIALVGLALDQIELFQPGNDPRHRRRLHPLGGGQLADRQRAEAFDRRQCGDLRGGGLDVGLLAETPRQPRHRQPKAGGQLSVVDGPHT